MNVITWFGFVLCAISAAGEIFFTGVGQKAKLNCGFKKLEHNLEWKREGELILKIAEKTGIRNKGVKEISKRANTREGQLEISDVKEDDAGKFTCHADGSEFPHILIVVSVSVAPSTTLTVGSSATLECRAAKADQISTEIYWKKPDNSTKKSPKVVLSSVVASDEGKWECHVSRQGKSFTKSVELTVEPQKMDSSSGPTQTSSKISKGVPVSGGDASGPQTKVIWEFLGIIWWIWVAAGAGGLVLIILVIVVIIMCKRTKRKKKKFMMMRNAQKPKTYCQCVRPTAAVRPQQGRRKAKPSALPLQPLLHQ